MLQIGLQTRSLDLKFRPSPIKHIVIFSTMGVAVMAIVVISIVVDIVISINIANIVVNNTMCSISAKILTHSNAHSIGSSAILSSMTYSLPIPAFLSTPRSKPKIPSTQRLLAAAQAHASKRHIGTGQNIAFQKRKSDIYAHDQNELPYKTSLVSEGLHLFK